MEEGRCPASKAACGAAEESIWDCPSFERALNRGLHANTVGRSASGGCRRPAVAILQLPLMGGPE